MDQALRQVAKELAKKYQYAHAVKNEDTDAEIDETSTCSPYESTFCSICTALGSITWLYKHHRGEKGTYDKAVKIYKQWSEGSWPSFKRECIYGQILLVLLEKAEQDESA